MNVYHSKLAEVVEVLEFTPTEDEESAARVINVPDGATALAIGVGRLDGRTFSRADNVTVSVTHNGEPLPANGAIIDGSGSNLRSYMSKEPPRGEWMIRVSHKTADAFVVSVAVFRRPLKALLSFKNKHQCKACKVAMRALIYAVLAKLTAGAITALDLKDFAKELAVLAKEIVEFLSHAIGQSVEWLQEAFGQVSEVFGFETPWGWLARRICEKLGLCPVGGSED